MFERFSKSARQVMVGACQAADRLGAAQLSPEHLLLGVASGERSRGLGLPEAGTPPAPSGERSRSRGLAEGSTPPAPPGEPDVGARVLAGFGLDAAALERALTERNRRANLSEAEIAALRAVGIDAEEVIRRIEEAFGDTAWFAAGEPDERSQRRLFGRVGGGRLSPDGKRVLIQSLREARALKHNYIGSEHFLLALLATGKPPLSEVLTAHGVTYQLARERVFDALRPTA